MNQHIPCRIKDSGIYILVLALLIFVLQPTNLLAGNTELKETVEQLQQNQSQIDNKLQQFSVVGNSVIAKNKTLTEQVEWFKWGVFTLTIILLLFMLLAWRFRRKNNAKLSELAQQVVKEANAEQYQTNQVANLQQFITDIREEVKEAKQGFSEKNQKFSRDLLQFRNDFQQFQSRADIAEQQLERLLCYPVDYAISVAKKEKLNQLINEDALRFSANLKARALAAEYAEDWQHAIAYWQTYLTDQGHNTEAYLHIGYANYQLAIENSQDEHYMEDSMQAFEKIMLAAPDYFDDMQGYDGEESLNEANDFNEDNKEYNLYQQLEKYLMKLDELRDYRSIYMLACKYANEGNVTAAENCFKQIPFVFHTAYCKQLQKDRDLAVLRQFDWFNDLVDSACQDRVITTSINSASPSQSVTDA